MARSYPLPKRQEPLLKIALDQAPQCLPDLWDRKRMRAGLATARPPLLDLLTPCLTPGTEENVFVADLVTMLINCLKLLTAIFTAV